MIIALTILHVLVCFFLIIVVLLQSGKAADIAGAFGGMGSQTAFGPRGAATILSKSTTIAAALFMVTSLSLSLLYTRVGGGGGASVLERAPQSVPLPATKGQVQIPIPAAPPVKVETPGGNTVEVPLPTNPPPAKAPAQPAVPTKK